MSAHLEPAAAGREPAWDRGEGGTRGPSPIPPLRTPPFRKGELVAVTLLGTVISEDADPALVELTEVPDVRRPIRLWVGQAEAARV